MKNAYKKNINEININENSSIESIIDEDFNILKDGIHFFINTINDLKKKLEKSEKYIKKLENDKISIKNKIKNIRMDSEKILSDIKKNK